VNYFGDLTKFKNWLVCLLLSYLTIQVSAQIQVNGNDLPNPNDINLNMGGLPSSGVINGLPNIPGLNMGAGGIPSLRAIDNLLPTPQQQTQSQPQSPILDPLKPNDFQRFVLETTGYKLPLYGQDFFENLLFNPINTAPVSNDYTLGPGDQVIVRGWGSLDIDAKLVIDRNGMVTIPRVGAIALAGVKASQAEAVMRTAVGKYYKSFELSVTLGQLRSITVYLVGQARRPGSYSISSVSTLVSALFATGGPNAAGSLRKVQLKRTGKVIAELDLYKFLSSGSEAAEIKLVDGDVIVIPAAVGYIALLGKVNNPAVYELKSTNETLDDILHIAGGLPIVADARRITLERLDPSRTPPRSVQTLTLDNEGLKTPLKNGDMISVAPIAPELSNSVTLRGSVTTPIRMAWREGMRVRDLIPSKEALITRDSIRRQNEAIFDVNQRERTQRDRNLKPDDLVSDSESIRRSSSLRNDDVFDIKAPNSVYASATPKKKNNNESATLIIDGLAESIGNLYDEINWDYALIERLNRNDLTVSLIPFNLANALSDDKSKDNEKLQPGDIVTVFSDTDVRIPQSKRRIFIRVEGEVAKPGIYQVKNGETLRDVLTRAGGLTDDAYLYGAALYRDEVKKSQAENLRKLIARLESDSSVELGKLGASGGANTEGGAALQVRLQAAQQAQKEAVQALKQLKPEGRVALSLPAELKTSFDQMPDMRLRNGDRLIIPSMPDYVYVYGAVNTESALLYTPGMTVRDYLKQAGLTEYGDRDAVIVLRANGSAISGSYTSWFSGVLGTKVMPGDSILVPQKTDLEPFWSAFTRNTKDITQIFYQLGLGAAALKTLRN